MRASRATYLVHVRVEKRLNILYPGVHGIMGHLSSEFGEIRAQRELCKEGYHDMQSTSLRQFRNLKQTQIWPLFSPTQVNRHMEERGVFHGSSVLAAAITSNIEDISLRYPRRVVGTTFLCNGQEHGERCRCYLP